MKKKQNSFQLHGNSFQTFPKSWDKLKIKWELRFFNPFIYLWLWLTTQENSPCERSKLFKIHFIVQLKANYDQNIKRFLLTTRMRVNITPSPPFKQHFQNADDYRLTQSTQTSSISNRHQAKQQNANENAWTRFVQMVYGPTTTSNIAKRFIGQQHNEKKKPLPVLGARKQSNAVRFSNIRVRVKCQIDDLQSARYRAIVAWNEEESWIYTRLNTKTYMPRTDGHGESTQLHEITLKSKLYTFCRGHYHV